MKPKDCGWVTVMLKTTADTLAGIPETPPTGKDTNESAPTGSVLRVSRNRDGATGTKAPGTAGVPAM